MALRAEYDGASYLRCFQPDQELEVKTVFVRFFDLPDEETKEAVRARSSRFSEALSRTVYQVTLSITTTRIYRITLRKIVQRL